jgi:hypothetical protein
MLMIPYADAAAAAGQTIIPEYYLRAPTHVERVVPREGFDVPTVIGDVMLDLQPLRARTEIRPESPEVPAVVEIPPLDALIANLYEYLTLTPDWDGEGGVPPKASAVFEAERFLRLLPEGFPLPKPMVASDGEVGLYWKSPDLHAEVTFTGDGEFSYFGRSGRRSILAENIALPHARMMDEMFALAA